MTINQAERRMAENLLLEALKLVESESIKAWARDIPKHREAWLSAAEAHLRKYEGRGDITRFALLITSTAIGL